MRTVIGGDSFCGGGQSFCGISFKLLTAVVVLGAVLGNPPESGHESNAIIADILTRITNEDWNEDNVAHQFRERLQKALDELEEQGGNGAPEDQGNPAALDEVEQAAAPADESGEEQAENCGYEDEVNGAAEQEALTIREQATVRAPISYVDFLRYSDCNRHIYSVPDIYRIGICYFH